ncbi:hypothetical protein MACK_002351 [Theileria orientalis]|uniref:Rho-GAP domain-containing protein n=1 Tax=Theileria orientalis TaxID=68886 RepID=A0A976QU90_THEOR|nr:hypothetical protein MACK_002351 [Theileria orientalis]
MASTLSYNVSGVLYDSDSEQVDYDGKSYDYYLKSDYNDETFKEDFLARYLGKGPNMERVLLLIPSVTPKVNENYEDSLRFTIKTLNDYLSSKYSLVICQTCVSWSDKSSYYFVNQWYNMLPSSKKKNLLKVYLIHSPMSTKTLLTLSSPFKSSKDTSKVEVVNNISDVLLKLELNKKSMLRNFPYIVQRTEEINLGINPPLSPFGTELWVLGARLGQRFKDFRLIPPVLSNVLTAIESKDFVTAPNLLNLQCSAEELYEVVTRVENLGENCSFNSPNEAVAVFKLILDIQPEPLFGNKGYMAIKNAVLDKVSTEEVFSSVRRLIKGMRPEQAECIYCIIKTLRAVARNHQKNGMSLKLISKVMAPSFFRPKTPDPYIYQLTQTSEHVVSNLVEKPNKFFPSEKDAKLVKTSEHSESTANATASGHGSSHSAERSSHSSSRAENSSDKASRERKKSGARHRSKDPVAVTGEGNSAHDGSNSGTNVDKSD